MNKNYQKSFQIKSLFVYMHRNALNFQEQKHYAFLRTNNKIADMNKKSWFIPILIVALNALAIIVRWSSLPELLPAHYDLQGNAGGTMPRSMLLMYILMGAVICLIAYVIGRCNTFTLLIESVLAS